MKKKYSLFTILKNTFTNHKNWQKMWRNPEPKKSYVEIQISGQKFERRDIELGISDGVYAEVLGGVTEKDNIKIWNKTEPLKRGDQEEQEYKYDN